VNPLYIYALVDRRLRPATIAGHRIEVITVSSLHAAVERIVERPALSETFLRVQYEIVTRLSQRAGAILPARFGAFVDEEELRTLVSLRGDDFRRGLAHVAGRTQMTVRLLPLRPSAKQDDGGPTPASGTEYLRRRQQAAASVPVGAAPLCAAVSALVADTRTESRSRPPLTTIMHLVPKTKASAYRRIMRQAAKAVAPDFAVSMSGPQPPFAFVPEIWP
jgi:gas vesicle protein GvpL/GvpF